MINSRGIVDSLTGVVDFQQKNTLLVYERSWKLPRNLGTLNVVWKKTIELALIFLIDISLISSLFGKRENPIPVNHWPLF